MRPLTSKGKCHNQIKKKKRKVCRTETFKILLTGFIVTREKLISSMTKIIGRQLHQKKR